MSCRLYCTSDELAKRKKNKKRRAWELEKTLQKKREREKKKGKDRI